ncbi:membrane protein insertase YidC [Halalkalibacter urbisdiaboli]|uniref:membrane protein insertase YidC n=1 Tax=Halalkalibacter urbisdiaboli TaxID=1960589 RepID=UPI001A98A2B5|nr:membrane protein insertase YidC [Halalkalibacter urbisdiaboli]
MKKTSLFIILIVITITLSGCGASQQPITADSQGIWNHFFVYPMSWIIITVADLLNGNFGLSIIVVTILIRVMLLPLMLKQQKSSRAMQALRPEIEALQKKYGQEEQKKDPKNVQKMQQELMALYQQNGVNPAAGCLPIFIQMPVLMAFYFAIMRTEEIAFHTFLWFDLGNPDPLFILPLIAGLTTFLQVKMTAHQLQGPMRMVMYIMPIMIIVAGITLPSALSLYWVVGNLFMIIQTYFTVVKSPYVTTEIGK